MWTPSKPIPIENSLYSSCTTPPRTSPLSSPPTIRNFPETPSPPHDSTVNDVANVDRLYDEILDGHRCRACSRFLCCAMLIKHADDCWAENFRGDLTFEGIQNIHKYRWSMMTGGCGDRDYDEELRAPARPEDLFGYTFRTHRTGFFVRCFTCRTCTHRDGKTCHAAFHSH